MIRRESAAAAAAAVLAAAIASPAVVLGGGIASSQIEMMFDRFDDNRDGQISLEEFEGIQEIRFYSADMDDDGVITRDELVFTRALRGVANDRTEAVFDRLDTDRNGRLSVHEFAATKLSAFESLDLDRDGAITPAEVIQFADRSNAGL